ncbi:phage tail protein [Silvimonas sp.]|uniref:phage tail protein n=1 Tax=Silvimonas sp. TaxID=2650811 RepID=UPI00284BB5EB|nr:phage tail protein [Silvimonas sp.]MDR3429688.1 phage tail protein [Silvimonas sp.]
MSAPYFAILTAIGEAKLANATALGIPLQLSHLAVGDGNGATPQPDRFQTKLVNEKRRAPLNSLSLDPQNPSQIITEQVIPEEVGGWWIRELGLYDKDGNLCAVANCAPSYKPQLAEGSGRVQVIRMVLIVTSTAAVELKIDPSVVLATRKYVDSQDAAHAAAADPHPQYIIFAAQKVADHEAKADPHPQYAQMAAQKITDHEAKADPHPQYMAGTAGQYVLTAGITPPPGTLACNGGAVSRTQYAKLFAQIGTKYGGGDGAATFNLPNVPDGYALLGGSAAAVGTSVVGAVILHGHGASTDAQGNHSHGASTDAQGSHVHGGATGGGGAHNHGIGSVGSQSSPDGKADPDFIRNYGEGTTLWTNTVGDHVHGIGWDGAHGHNISVAAAGNHAHNVTVAASGNPANYAAGLKVLVCIRY